MTSSLKEPMVVINHLTWFYESSEQPAIQDLSLEVYKGEILGIMAPTLAGKTTLCYAMAGLIPNSLMGAISGTVQVDGADTQKAKMHELSLKVGVVFDNPDYQFSQSTVEEEVAFGLENRGVDPDLMPGLIAGALETVGLSGFEKRSPFELSGGQQQRLAIACVIVVKPNLLILDEPTSFLDPEGKSEVYMTVKRLNEEGKTIVIADHEVELMATICDRIMILSHGQLFAVDKTRAILSRVTELKGIGLRVPQVTEIVRGLLPNDREELPVTVESAVDYVKTRMSA